MIGERGGWSRRSSRARCAAALAALAMLAGCDPGAEAGFAPVEPLPTPEADADAEPSPAE
jgi:hypothetical protein